MGVCATTGVCVGVYMRGDALSLRVCTRVQMSELL